MMNRRTFLKWMLVATGIVAFGSVVAEADAGSDAPASEHAAKGKTGEDTMKIAVVYYSWGGNTRFAAETIARKANGDLYEIQPETPYPSDYRTCCDEAKSECYGKKLRPIKPTEGLDLAKYDIVFVGTPNWYGTMAPPVRTWVTQSKKALADKKVCLFQTNGGGGMQRVGKEFAEILDGEAMVLPPKAFSGSSIQSKVAEIEGFVTESVRK